MKKCSRPLFWLISLILIGQLLFADTRLGAIYTIFRDNSPYVSAEGDNSIKTLPKGTRVRLIKDDSVMETIIMVPVRIFSLMFTVKPRGNWLIEDELGNRGYMWASDLELVKKK